jgi:peptidyl-tRNA hydrolase, PTH1 family
MDAMQLWAGLGNPGPAYSFNRHNIGFLAVDEIARVHGFSPWRKRWSAEVCEGRVGDARVLLVKPQSYMNHSGHPVSEASAFYKIPASDVLVFHDELDLEPARVKIKKGGGHAGHNGLRSIMAQIGADFRRVRLGIGHPGHKDRVSDYVLSDFAKSERVWLEALCDAVARDAPMLAANEDGEFQNRVHLALRDFLGDNSAPKT